MHLYRLYCCNLNSKQCANNFTMLYFILLQQDKHFLTQLIRNAVQLIHHFDKQKQHSFDFSQIKQRTSTNNCYQTTKVSTIEIISVQETYF